MSGVNESVLARAVVDTIRGFMPIPVGDGEAPNHDDRETDRLEPQKGYAMVLATGETRTESEGWTGQPDAMMRLTYRLLGFGIQRHQSAHIVSGMVDGLTTRDGSSYTFPIVAAGHRVMQVRRVRSIPSMREAGVWQSGTDIEVMVHATA